MKIPEIDTVCFVGAGTMGCVNAITAGLAGYSVIIYDLSAASLEAVPARFQEIADYLVAQALCPQAMLDYVVSQIRLTDNLAEATAQADLVSESVFESLALKREVHEKLDKICSPDTLITTNTSGLLVSEIEDVVSDERGRLFGALHSHMGSALIDIVGGPRTTQSTIDILERYVLSLSGVPLILKKENPGYVLNAMLGPVLATAMLMVQNGIATVEEVDRAWISQAGVSIGPFGLIDLFGLNVIYDSWLNKKPGANYDATKSKIMALITPFIEAGNLGAKSGKGFYLYPNPAYSTPEFLAADDHSVGTNFALLSSALVNTAVLLAVNDVASPETIDNAWNVSMATTQGPFELLQALGGKAYLQRLDAQFTEGWFDKELNAPVKAYIAERFV